MLITFVYEIDQLHIILLHHSVIMYARIGKILAEIKKCR